MAEYEMIQTTLNIGSYSSEIDDPNEALNNLSCSINLKVECHTIVIENEPVIYFLREYHTALINSIVFAIPTSVFFFANDISVELEKDPGVLDDVIVRLRIGTNRVASTLATRRELSDIFRDAVSQVVDFLIPRFTYAKIAETLSSSMIPMNEGYLTKFLQSR